MGQDVNYQSYWGETNLVISGQTFAPENPTQYSDILKFSLCTGVVVQDTYVVGGKEDCIDAVRGENYKIRNCKLRPNGENGITLKGNLNGAYLKNIVFETHGSSCDIELGQHTIYSNFFGSNQRTTNVTLTNVNSKTDKPVVVRVWNADKPTVTNSNVKLKVVPSFIVKLYYAFRWIQIHIFDKIFK